MQYASLLPILLLFFSACNSSAQEQGATASAFTDLSVEEFKAKMQEKDVVILDVRTPQEIAAGKIEGAVEININAPGFSEKIDELDKSKTYLVYCKSGGRSVRACNTMSEVGLPKLYNLVGGYTAWKAAQ